MTKSELKQPLRCFLSSPRLVDTAKLRDVLTRLAVEVASVDALPTAGDLSSSELVNRIREATFVVGVVSDIDSSAVLFEVGIALGMSKPVFLVADDKESLTTSLLGLPLVVAPLSDTNTLQFHLQNFVASLSFARPKTQSKVIRMYGGGEAIPTPLTGGQLAEARVAAAFRKAGSEVTVSPRFNSESEADMIVWLSSAMDLGAGGPLLVEVKSTARESFPQGAIHQVERLLEKSHLRAAVLVTNSPEKGVAARMIKSSFLYSLSIAELERLAEADMLPHEFIKARNRLAHGVTLR